jgi:hypothetical protein
LAKTIKASDHLERVAAAGCAVCELMGLGYSPAEVHHIGDTAERSDFLTIGPLPGASQGGPPDFMGSGNAHSTPGTRRARSRFWLAFWSDWHDARAACPIHPHDA